MDITNNFRHYDHLDHYASLKDASSEECIEFIDDAAEEQLAVINQDAKTATTDEDSDEDGTNLFSSSFNLLNSLSSVIPSDVKKDDSKEWSKQDDKSGSDSDIDEDLAAIFSKTFSETFSKAFPECLRKEIFKKTFESTLEEKQKSNISKYNLDMSRLSTDQNQKINDLKERHTKQVIEAQQKMVDAGDSDLSILRALKPYNNRIAKESLELDREIMSQQRSDMKTMQRKANRNRSKNSYAIMNFSAAEQKAQVMRKAIALNGNLSMKQAEKELMEFESGRDSLELRLKAAEYLKKAPISLTEEDMAAYNQHLSTRAEDVYQSFAKDLAKQAKKKKKPKQAQPPAEEASVSVTPPAIAAPTVIAAPPVIAKPTLSASDLRSRKAIELSRQKPPFDMDDRVTKRWITKDLNQLRQLGPTYACLDDEDLALERSKHYWPGLEKLITRKEDRDIYTFPTDRGLGVVCEMTHEGKKQRGIIYYGIGIDEKTGIQTIFHRWFVPRNLTSSRMQELFNDPSPQVTPESGGKWTSVGSHTFQYSDKGVVTLTYDDEPHSLRIMPLRHDLLDPKAFSVTQKKDSKRPKA